ncbi:MAG: DUF362 domain-containing protein [Bacteroidales bacterium]|nr:DUF362 domain-containing protein [Bacteroidales bacterium]MBN2820940.1 DUF362 domain-containing protein [Bacteroidales bacterium]
MKNSKTPENLLTRLKRKLISFKFPPKFIFIFMGIASTLWFLIRVLPKPQRAGYPCIRAAAPIMSGFVIYILSLGGITLFFKKAVEKFKKAKYMAAVFASVAAVGILVIFNWVDAQRLIANTTFTRGVLPDAPNNPMGQAFGVNPGRVVWVWNPAATNKDCENVVVSTGGWWSQVMDWENSDAFFMPKNNNQDTINKMADDAIKALAGETTVANAWDALFNNFNERKNGTAAGYTAGQTIFIKVNNGQAGWAINSSDLSEKGNNSATGVENAAMANTTPATVVAILRQLIDECGIAQSDIYVAEPMTHVYKSLYDAINNVYPDVVVLDKEDKSSLGRTQTSGWKSNSIIYSDKGSDMPDGIKDVLMNEMYNADYLINIPALKAHARGGVTLTAKNHFGSHGDHGGNDWGSFTLHDGLICTVDNDVFSSGVRGDYGMYRVLTDIMGHDKLGGNTILFVMDGLWGGIEATDMPVHWNMAPFNGDFPNSLLLAQDAVALESVCLDFLRAEADNNADFNDRPYFPAVDDHIHQAAEKANWAQGFIYDPENDGTEMPSMGVHEHWNNSTDKQYSKNLFSNGTGIELFSIPSSLVNNESAVANSLTVTVTTKGTPVEDAIVVINGSKYRTNSAGEAVIGNMTDVADLSYSVQKQGYTNYNGQVVISGDAEVNVELEKTTGIGATNSNNNFSVYPNPSTESTTLSYYLDLNSNVTITLIAMNGKQLTLIENEYLSAGAHTLTINTNVLSSGIYVCKVFSKSGANQSIQNIKLIVQ